MAYIIHLICCSLMGVMCSHLGLWFNNWEHWVLIVLPIISYCCGRYYEASNKGGK